jgi:hypothetical protein
MFSKLILKIILKNKKIKQKSTATIIQNDHERFCSEVALFFVAFDIIVIVVF